MRYLYTNTPDEGCHEISGVYGRPVRSDQIGKLLKAGWKIRPEDCLPAEQTEDPEHIALMAELSAAYEAKIGKPPHHKMKPETILKAIEDHDKAAASQSDTDTDGDQHPDIVG